MTVETDRAEPDRRGSLYLQLLGPLTIRRDGVAVTLPASRKVRALIAYLSLAPQAVSRSQLCELLWDVPDDPRGELRWCLSKLRNVIDASERRRVETPGDAVRLDMAECFVDAVEVAQAVQRGIALLSPDRLRALSALFKGEFLDRLEIDRNPGFNSWLTTQRRRFRGYHTALLEHLARRASDDEVFEYLETWLALAPFDRNVHEVLLRALARRGRIREGEEHLAATGRLFESEGLDCSPIADMWRSSPRATAVLLPPSADSTGGRLDGAVIGSRRASVAVMPFVDRIAAKAAPGGPADAFAHDVITRLAKLRSLFVIAQGTVFALSERQVGPEEAGRMLNVDYVVSGWMLRGPYRLTVAVEVTETRAARIIWAEVFERKVDDVFAVLNEIGDRIVASVTSEIEAAERNRAILKPPSSLDAWDAHHRGLWHMYRFNNADNERAQHFFEMAVRLDPTFARAYAGLSFTHFQSAFQGWEKRESQIDRAFETAGQSLMADDRDPAAHWAMGRALNEYLDHHSRNFS